MFHCVPRSRKKGNTSPTSEEQSPTKSQRKVKRGKKKRKQRRSRTFSGCSASPSPDKMRDRAATDPTPLETLAGPRVNKHSQGTRQFKMTPERLAMPLPEKPRLTLDISNTVSRGPAPVVPPRTPVPTGVYTRLESQTSSTTQEKKESNASGEQNDACYIHPIPGSYRDLNSINSNTRNKGVVAGCCAAPGRVCVPRFCPHCGQTLPEGGGAALRQQPLPDVEHQPGICCAEPGTLCKPLYCGHCGQTLPEARVVCGHTMMPPIEALKQSKHGGREDPSNDSCRRRQQLSTSQHTGAKVSNYGSHPLHSQKHAQIKQELLKPADSLYHLRLNIQDSLNSAKATADSQDDPTVLSCSSTKALPSEPQQSVTLKKEGLEQSRKAPPVFDCVNQRAHLDTAVHRLPLRDEPTSAGPGGAAPMFDELHDRDKSPVLLKPGYALSDVSAVSGEWNQSKLQLLVAADTSTEDSPPLPACDTGAALSADLEQIPLNAVGELDPSSLEPPVAYSSDRQGSMEADAVSVSIAPESKANFGRRSHDSSLQDDSKIQDPSH